MNREMPLTGRSREMEQIDAVLQESGAPAFVIAGPAGVGKSRLAAEAAKQAANRGYRVSWIVGTSAASSIPLGAFAPLLPNIEPTAAGPLGLLRRAGELVLAPAREGQPLLLGVDDAHLLDQESAALVHQLIHYRSCAVILTVRTPGSGPETITALWKDGLASRVDLRPLSEHELAELASGTLGGPLTGASLRWLSKSSEGNPLYARELLVGALESGTLTDRGGIWALTLPMPPPERLAELIRARLANQPEHVTQLLDLLAIGEPLGFSTLESVFGSEALERAELEGLIAIRHHGDRAAVQLGHPLYGEVIRHGMPLARRRRLCSRLAHLFEEAGSHRHDDIMRIAQWQLDADVRPDPGVLEAAARAAKQLFDLDLAGRLARAALDAGAGAAAGLILGEAEFFRGHHQAAEAVLSGVQDHCRNDDERAMIASARSYNLGFLMNQKEQAIAVIDEALREITDPGARLRLLGRLAITRLYAREIRPALVDAAQLIESADDGLVHRGMMIRSTGLAFLGRTGEAVATAQLGWEAHKRSGDHNQQLAECQLIGSVLGHAGSGDLTSAAAEARASYEACLEANDSEGVATFALLRGLVDVEQGRLQAAATMFREGVSINREINDPGVLRWCLGGVVLAEGMAGDATAARAALAELDSIPEHWMSLFGPDLLDRGRAWAHVAAGEVSKAVADLITSAAEAGQTEQRIAEARLLHDAARLGDPRRVAGRLGELSREVDGDLVPAMAYHADALVSRSGDHLAEASERFEAMSSWLLAAEAATAARDAFTVAGLERKANASARRAVDLLGHTGPVRTPGLAGPISSRRLTRREREVATLAASGDSSREIADRLFLSERTVDNHLQHVYDKLGIRSRNELGKVLQSG